MLQACTSLYLTQRNLAIETSRLRVTTIGAVGAPLEINQAFEGLQKIHSNPDVYVIENFLDLQACDDMIARAKEKTLDPSPVAYAGWTTDSKELLSFAARGKTYRFIVCK